MTVRPIQYETVDGLKVVMSVRTWKRPDDELMESMAKLYGSEDYADMTIKYGKGKQRSAHRAIMCSRSEFFKCALKGGFKEASTGEIDLSADDAEAVDHMLYYIYHNKYPDPKRCTSNRESKHRESQMSCGDYWLLEGPREPHNMSPSFMAAAAEYNRRRELASQHEHSAESGLNDEKPSASRRVRFSENEGRDVKGEEHPETGAESSAQSEGVTHVHVYAIAEKYGLEGLKTLARQRFKDDLPILMKSSKFPEICHAVFETTIQTDRGLRDLVVQAFRAQLELHKDKKIRRMLNKTPDLALELYDMLCPFVPLHGSGHRS
ncbi:hypothetical protein M011DRAFT_471520 [Sporormia fimetaria CBS 119925]|uniref:BTB domain-containing protein n=1 Tax=Sporormia fimetaria CBS 119925 TaxID=1340428 RepID=A0A6A6V0P8_9PLEO|nr:hypothetical protein M011DRAFT_471520 [Sporormia fimetaria CBS 119925]